MHQLLLLRHAKSSWDDPSLADHARPLNARGRRAARLMAEEMARRGLCPDLVLVSSARRTLQTLEALQPFEETPIVTVSDELYLAPWQTILAVLQRVPDTVRSVLLIGHNPGLHELALNLIPAEERMRPAAARLRQGYPTAALCEFAVIGPWRTLREGGARLLHFLAPRDLPGADAVTGAEEGA
ncbi:MAG: histidine phosphatase family protein [Rhodovarius sp.]|nr:histidine phosphatase family protein [Rhodovarius sp.]MCX7931555.1 histidine phosphatase family protein [Rhodovarius sp.]MDW8314863.1 histidine phosphatase family protein [Rhodovarius sp.]